MGYMGFGLQKWIYTLKPRKPFSMDRKPTGDTLPEYHREFNIKPATDKPNSRLRALFTLFILVVLLAVTGLLIIRFSNTTSTNYKNYQKVLQNEDVNGFQVLFKTGLYYYEKGEWNLARSEFELALKLQPENEALQKYYAFTLLQVSSDNPEESAKAMQIVDQLLAKYPENASFLKVKSELEFLIEKQNTY